MRINELDYQSSYIITSDIYDEILKNYNKIKFGEINLYYDEHIDVLTNEFKNKSILLIGYCFDIRDGLKEQQNILADLLTAENLHRELDYINGRYNLLIKDENNKCYLYSDASQLRPLVYHQPSKTLASHDSLLTEVLSNQGYEVKKRDQKKHNEFDYTRFFEIFKFNPSLYLSYNNFEFVRLYPREELKQSTSESVFYELKKYLDESIKYLEKSKLDIFVTITGGIDSRVSAALTRNFSNNIKYLTYTQSKEKLATDMARKIYEIDEQVAIEMREHLGWNHSIINLDNYQVSKNEATRNNIKYNSKHSYSLANYYSSVKKDNKALHIKSTVFGMGKADFPKELDNFLETLEFYKKCVHGLPNDYDMNNFDTDILEYFERNKVDNNISKGRHYFDIYHLESRMGNWHSMLTLETDPETEEFIFTNSRKIIDLIQQPFIKERRDFSLYKQIINYYWPVLLKFGINKNIVNKENLMFHSKIIKYKEVDVIPLENMNIYMEDNHIKALPDTYLPSTLDNYIFVLNNQSSINKKIKITSYYKNLNAKGKIFIIIRDSKNLLTYDILDLNKGIHINLEKNPLIISILYTKNFIKNSWVKAGRLTLEISDN